ncbi:S-layer homology domain-containing protein [Desulforamulus ruminis]|uniref:S-layer homology domain-containing protein n=1 Tax=Desulforamulus ruminis TaxID=1564 RepID=UPI003B5B27E5
MKLNSGGCSPINIVLASISPWAKESVTTAMEHNMMKGYPADTFKPTRAEAATVILKSIQ